jgi:hypothetical protein
MAPMPRKTELEKPKTTDNAAEEKAARATEDLEAVMEVMAAVATEDPEAVMEVMAAGNARLRINAHYRTVPLLTEKTWRSS